MNRAQYKSYEQSVAAFFEREGLNCLTAIDSQGEPYFSWQHCEVCDRGEGGNRENCNGFNPTTREIQGPYSVCQDCIYYIAYGQLDDMTMLKLDDE